MLTAAISDYFDGQLFSFTFSVGNHLRLLLSVRAANFNFQILALVFKMTLFHKNYMWALLLWVRVWLISEYKDLCESSSGHCPGLLTAAVPAWLGGCRAWRGGTTSQVPSSAEIFHLWRRGSTRGGSGSRDTVVATQNYQQASWLSGSLITVKETLGGRLRPCWRHW